MAAAFNLKLARCLTSISLLSCIAIVPAFAADESATDSTPSCFVVAEEAVAIEREVRDILGWKVHIDKRLLTKQAAETGRALELLKKMLAEVTQVVPEKAVVELRKVPLYFSPEYPRHGARAEYHPGAGWLRDNGRDPVMVKAIEFTNVRNFEAEVKRMPNFALHELAHAYHDRVLPNGYGNSPLQEAFARAKASGKYEKVERWFGNGRPNSVEKAYALSNPQEYFAETTEAFFSRNDFFPFDREELKRHDPEVFQLLGQLWGKAE